MSCWERESLSSVGPINVIIIDSQRLFRDALRRLLDASPVTVVGEGRNVEEALRSIRMGTPLHLAVYNFSSDEEALRELLRLAGLRPSYPDMKLVVLADLQQQSILLGAAQAGVEALLSRDISSDVLQRALELVQLGQRLVPTELVRLFVDPISRTPPARASQREAATTLTDPGRAASLTPRECQILQCLMDGRSNKEIARDLQLTEATVKAHVKALLRKTRMTNRTQAAIWAITNNFQFNEAREVESFYPEASPEFVMPDLRLLRANTATSGASNPVQEVVPFAGE